MSEQKFKFSIGKNSLIVEIGQFKGHYKAVKSNSITCDNCSFWQGDDGCALGGVQHAKCAPDVRPDGNPIIWQKVQLEQKDKKAVAVFYDEKILEIRHSNKHDGDYEAKESHGCDGCFFNGKTTVGCTFNVATLGNQKCSPYYRDDDTPIIWIKKETEMTEAPAPAPTPAPTPTAERFSREAILARLQHRHFDLIVQWAKNPTQPVWMWNGIHGWEKAEHLMWTMKHYAIGEKPTEPPVKMVKYNGGSIEFPEPAKVKLKRYKDYWAATIYGVNYERWTDHSTDIELLDNGLIQLTKEGAEKQSEALVELLKNHTQKWG